MTKTDSSTTLFTPQVHPEHSGLLARLAAVVRSLHFDDPRLVALMGVAFLLRFIFWVYTNRTWEDALITALHSENFYHGLGLTHFRIDDPKPLHGFTSPISVLVPLLADRFHVGWGLPFEKLLSLLTGPVAVWFGYRILRDYLASCSRAAAVLGAGYIAIEHHQILWGMAGMETEFATAVLLAAIYFLLSGNIKACAIMSGVCLLARPDFILWTVIATASIAYMAYRRKALQPLVTFVLLVCAVYGPWLIFATIYYGSPIPNTVVAKTLGYVGYWETTSSARQLLAGARGALATICLPLEPVFGGNGTGFIPLIKGLWLEKLSLAVIAFGLVAEVVRQRGRFWSVYVFAISFAAFLTFRVPQLFGWYTVPLSAVFALLVAKGMADITGLLSRRSGAVVSGLLTAVYLGSFAAVLPTTFRAERNIQLLVENGVRMQIGTYLSHTPLNTTIAGEPLGYIGYYSRRTYYDYPGLCSRRVVQWLRVHKYPRVNKMLQLFACLRPDYLVLRKFEYENFVKQKDGAFLKDEYHLEREFAVAPEDRRKLFRPENNIDLDFMVFARNTGLSKK